LKTVVFDIIQFMLSLALNFVKEKDKNSILVHIFKHSKLSQKTQQKHAWKFAVNTNLRLRYEFFFRLPIRVGLPVPDWKLPLRNKIPSCRRSRSETNWIHLNRYLAQNSESLIRWCRPVVNFINILRAAFAPIFFSQKIIKLNSN
jgi:hypothetical protein